MNMIILKKQFVLLMILLFCGVVSYAADNDLITKQIIIKLEKAGTLSNKIGSSKRDKITNLKIVGEMNADDFDVVCRMGGDSGHLAILDLSEVKIKDDYLPSYAFYDCSGLTSLAMPSDITSITDMAFSGCSGLTSLAIPSGVTSIGGYAFSGCSGLTSLAIPLGVTSIGDGAFSGCSGLTSLAIPLGVTSIGDGAFSGCSGLTNLTIPSGVTSISYETFSGCSGLTSLAIPSGVTSIGGGAFSGCSGLTSLAIPSDVTSIGSATFYDCSGLTNLTIPSGVTSIGGYAFSGCSGLTSLAIPSGVTSIGDMAFSGCSGLSSIYVGWEIPLSSRSIGASAFYMVDKEKCTLYVPKGAFQDYWLADVWGDFDNIVEYDVTGVDKVTTSADAKEVSRYSVNGQRLSAPTKGLNIVKYSDGSVKKVAVQ